MPRYLFQGTADSGGQHGPTLQRVQDRALFQRGKANVLENLFDAVAPLGMYSGEAHGRLGMPMMTPAIKTALKDAIAMGATPNQILRDFNLFYDGRTWSKYTPDELSDLSTYFAKKNKYGRFEDFSGPSKVSLGDLIKNTPAEHANVPVSFRKDLPVTTGGLADVGSNPAISINVRDGRSLDELLGTLSHEGQHIMEPIGKSRGANPSNINKVTLDRVSRQVGREVSPLEYYFHNTGELRAEGNKFLNKEGQTYNGLQDLFEGKQYNFDPNLVWGD